LQPVAGNRFPIAMVQRLDILIDLPKTGAFPILAQLEGGRWADRNHYFDAGARISPMTDSAKAAPPVDNSLEARLVAVEPLTSRSADIVHTIALAGVVHQRRILAAGHAADAGERKTC
jgi:FtsP/CotA-like multicopper oxidase with cupredoxin domain